MSTTQGRPTGPVVKAGGAAADYVDERVGVSKFLKKNLSKIFPDHWSFMLGEIALYSFIVLLLSGTFLSLFFKPSMAEVAYHGSYVAAQRHQDVGGVRLDAQHLVRRPRRPADAAGAPLGGAAVPRRDHRCTCSGCSSPARSASRASSTG